MGIRVYKPTSPARRFMSVLTFDELTKKAYVILKKDSKPIKFFEGMAQ